MSELQARAATAEPWAVDRSSTDVVTRIDGLPALEALPTMTPAKARPGEPIRFGITVIAEPTGKQGKRALIAGPGPGWNSFEVFSDEGAVIGGADSAPSPLSYFASGAAFCLLTHVCGYVRNKHLSVSRLKVELRARYAKAIGTREQGGEGPGRCEGFEVYVIIDSNEDSAAIAELMAVCQDACMAMQTVIHAVPTSTRIRHNGTDL